jgi:glycosyltransferase involved in cell wall biosynthesis
LNTKKKILIICNAPFISGAEINLFQLLNYLDKKKYAIFLIVPNKVCGLNNDLVECSIIRLPFVWFVRSFNPFYLIKCLYSIIYCSFKIQKAIRKNNIDIIYSNSIKSHIYCIIPKIITGKKAILHIRDNLKNNILTKLLIKTSDKIICISNHIYSQINALPNKKILVYGGIDTNEWIPLRHFQKNDLTLKLGLTPETKIVTQISQITSWKNHFDFIKAAGNVVKNCTVKVHFLIVGDDLSGKEKKYKRKLKTELSKAGLEKHFSFIGFVQDIKQVYSQIDILVHPAINEPFGRVVIEAMAMGKPIIAYNCGGPKEIIAGNQTGYLVDIHDYNAIANKIILLLKDENLRVQLGKEGRERVIEKFNIKNSISDIEALIDNILACQKF